MTITQRRRRWALTPVTLSIRTNAITAIATISCGAPWPIDPQKAARYAGTVSAVTAIRIV